MRRRASEIAVSVPPNVALYMLNQKRHALSEIEKRYGFSVLIEAEGADAEQAIAALTKLIAEKFGEGE